MVLVEVTHQQLGREKQIACGNDNKKNKGSGKSKLELPAGMTTKGGNNNQIGDDD